MPKFLAIFNDNKEIIYSTWYTDAEQKAEFDLSFGIAERISEILKAKGLTQKDFARLLNSKSPLERNYWFSAVSTSNIFQKKHIINWYCQSYLLGCLDIHLFVRVIITWD